MVDAVAGSGTGAGVKLAFVKMEGAGNDYIYLDGLAEPLPDLPWPQVARRVSDRRFGIGGDGLILVRPESRLAGGDIEPGGAGYGGAPGRAPRLRMEMYNADGSRGLMCGNGIRCVAKLAFDAGHVRDRAFPIATDSGVLVAEIVETDDAGRATRVRVDMGEPTLIPSAIPARVAPSLMEGPFRGAAAGVPIEIMTESIPITAVSMGNPHCVVFMDEIPQLAPATPDAVRALEAFDVPVVGPAFERHPVFPEGVNTEFVVVESPTRLRMRVWERGSGETWACGTGACATLVASVIRGRSERRATVVLRGGELEVEWRKEDDRVYLTGPATEVFRGVYEYR